MLSVYSGRDCFGHILNCGPRRGMEAFDRHDRSLGMFRDLIEASNAIERAITEASS
jgi:hypothetical protein